MRTIRLFQSLLNQGKVKNYTVFIEEEDGIQFQSLLNQGKVKNKEIMIMIAIQVSGFQSLLNQGKVKNHR